MAAAPRHRPTVLSSSLLAVAAAGLWVSSRMSWVGVTADDDKLGALTRSIDGATWATETTIVAIVLAAAVVAVLVLRGVSQQLIALVTVAAAVLAGIRPAALMTSPVDTERARQLLVTGAATQKSTSPTGLTQWADITGVSLQVQGPLLALAALLLAVVAGLVVAVRPGHASPASTRFDAAATRRDNLEEDLSRAPESERVLWDALDNGIDPTDTTDGADTTGPTPGRQA
ncbi:TIGR02234 family membrane protein [Corynebacterium mendelii]|uniref:TIGR02234 family membrane protein n=1 Tax=Corynebacterium mendelii TaxID=2765362 RepID=A0A939DZC3_9CORY|nr:TIGR02234 family membrane protein [Corynebacterium mendelii]